MAVTSINDIKSKAVKEVEITGFEVGETITLKLRRLSLMGLVSKGMIPNALMGVAVELFEGKQVSKQTEKDKGKTITDLAGIIDVVCENAMVDPKFSDVGEDLTDEQKMEIFYYAQGGVNDLKSFRAEQGDTEHNSDSQNI
jgi:hypothetical protein